MIFYTGRNCLRKTRKTMSENEKIAVIHHFPAIFYKSFFLDVFRNKDFRSTGITRLNDLITSFLSSAVFGEKPWYPRSLGVCVLMQKLTFCHICAITEHIFEAQNICSL